MGCLVNLRVFWPLNCGDLKDRRLRRVPVDRFDRQGS